MRGGRDKKSTRQTGARGKALGRALRIRYCVPTSKPMRSRSTGRKKRARPHIKCGSGLIHRIASAERAAHVAKDLLGPQFFSGWGIRTVASGQSRYNQCPTTTARSGHMQQPHRPRLRPLQSTDSCRARIHGSVRGGELYGVSTAPGAVFAACSARGSRTHALSCRLLAAGLGERNSVCLLAASLGLEFDPRPVKSV